MKSIILTSLSSLALCAPSHSQVTITLSGIGTGNTALVTLEGSLTLLNAGSRSTSGQVSLPNGGAGGSYQPLGSFHGTPSGTPFKLGNISNETNDPNSFGRAIVTDTSNGGAQLIAWDVRRFTSLGSSQTYTISDLVGRFRTDAVDAGDIITLSGSFTTDLGTLTFDEIYNEGTYSGTYNSQAVNLVIDSVPEPSGVLLGLLGSVFLIGKRKR